VSVPIPRIRGVERRKIGEAVPVISITTSSSDWINLSESVVNDTFPALDAVKFKYHTSLITNACAGVSHLTTEAALKEMAAAEVVMRQVQ
jgi:hypothetical protein